MISKNSAKRRVIMSKGKSSLFHTLVLIIFILYLGFIGFLYYANISPNANIPRSMWGFATDKVVHFFMFLPYPFLAHGSFRGKRKWRNLVFVIITGIMLAFALELTQEKLAPYRCTDPWDLVYNMAAITISSTILAIIDLFRK